VYLSSNSLYVVHTHAHTVFQSALLLCMVMLLMDPSSNSNKSGVHRAGAKKASSLRGSGSGTSTGSTSYEKELATINQRVSCLHSLTRLLTCDSPLDMFQFEVLLDPTDTKSLNTHMKIRFPGQKTPDEVLSAHNVTGVYRGENCYILWSIEEISLKL
jgi:hypothetical protein